MTESTINKPKPAKNRKVLLVRYGRMKVLGLFEHEETHVPRMPARVVVKTEKGLEIGEVIGSLTSYREGRFRLTEEQVCGYYANSEINFSGELAGKFVRFATPDDISEDQHLQRIASEEIACCERIANELGLRMKIVDAEHIFGGERIIFYFMAEGRIDFRELVRRLAQEFQTRIEMRQIGSRDEAKLLGDIETCGQECCCLRFLQLLKPVNMRMAKMQKATLDPSKISGYCGRLKCCLRYEDETYVELKKRLPKKNAWVQTNRGEGKVLDGQILTQLVLVEFEGGEKEAFPVDEITVLPGPPIRPEKPQEQAPSPQQGRRSRRHGRDANRDNSRNAGNDNRTHRDNRGGRDNGNRRDDANRRDNGNPSDDARRRDKTDGASDSAPDES
jgi:cell fate regulator YaaT (PSP1 superfamily)